MQGIDDIFRDWREPFLVKYANRLRRSHRRAIADICKCRTEEMIHGTLYSCPKCGERHFLYRSCGNRNCPKCGNYKTTQWLEKRQQDILPVNYFMVTVALPAELRPLCRYEPEKVYNIFFKTASDSLKELTLSKRFLGGQVGMIATLQTWRRDGEFHPHMHFLVPGGGLSKDGKYWLYPKKRDFLVAAKPLAKLFRGKFKAAIEIQQLNDGIPSLTWQKNWVTDVKNVGNGMSSFKYIAPYMQRGFIGNNRIENYDGKSVTFRYKNGQTGQTCHRTMTAIEFMWLYIQHVLPSGLQKTRYYGILGSAHKKNIAEIRLLILTSRGQEAIVFEPEIFNIQLHLCKKCGTILKIEGYRARPPPELRK